MAGYCEKVASIQDKRSVLYHSFEEALLKLKANKDNSGFQSTIKKIAGEWLLVSDKNKLRWKCSFSSHHSEYSLKIRLLDDK